MVEVFKTNVRKKSQSKMLLDQLSAAFPLYKINFDLTDTDHILRVEGDFMNAPEIISLLTIQGFKCEVLE